MVHDDKEVEVAGESKAAQGSTEDSFPPHSSAEQEAEKDDLWGSAGFLVFFFLFNLDLKSFRWCHPNSGWVSPPPLILSVNFPRYAQKCIY